MEIPKPKYGFKKRINAAWSKDDIRSTGKIVDREFRASFVKGEFHGGWWYRVVFDDIDYSKHQQYWYVEDELKKGFVTKW